MRMDGMATSAARTIPLEASFLRWLMRSAVLTVLVLLALAGALVLARRVSGALLVPLPTLTLAALGVALAGVGLFARRLLADSTESPAWRIAVWAAPTSMLLLWMLAVTLPGTSSLGLVLFCGVILLEEGWSWGRFRAAASPAVPAPAAFSTAQSVVGTNVSALPNEPIRDDLVHDEVPAGYDEAISQQMVRRREQSGEVLTGWTRVDFAQAQRVAAAHIAICPPLELDPSCEAEQQDGPAAEVRVTQAMSYGVRLEVKLDEPAEEATSVIVEFAIQKRGEVEADA